MPTDQNSRHKTLDECKSDDLSDKETQNEHSHHLVCGTHGGYYGGAAVRFNNQPPCAPGRSAGRSVGLGPAIGTRAVTHFESFSMAV